MNERLIAFFEAVGMHTYLQVNLLRLEKFEEMVAYWDCYALHYDWKQRQKRTA